jgi:hypothetical protein
MIGAKEEGHRSIQRRTERGALPSLIHDPPGSTCISLAELRAMRAAASSARSVACPPAMAPDAVMTLAGGPPQRLGFCTGLSGFGDIACSPADGRAVGTWESASLRWRSRRLE